MWFYTTTLLAVTLLLLAPSVWGNEKAKASVSEGRGKGDVLVINERDVVKDAKSVIAGQPRPFLPDEHTTLIDTTYATLGDLLLLDISMMFEERLQETIEKDEDMLAAVKEMVDLIHKNLNIPSVQPLIGVDDTSQWKPLRQKFIAETFFNDATARNFITTDQKYKDANNGDLAADAVGFQNLISKKDFDFAYLKNNVNDPVLKGYVGLAKMLATQNPYFGGSIEYAEGHADFEFWVYHLSSLTKDPARSYIFDNNANGNANLKKLPKPLLDYRTYIGGMVPYHNQKNLASGMAEIPWAKVPVPLQNAILDEYERIVALLTPDEQRRLAGNAGDDDPLVQMEGKDLLKVTAYLLDFCVRNVPNFNPRQPVYPARGDIPALWNSWDIDFARPQFYNNIIRLGWSDAHVLDHAKNQPNDNLDVPHFPMRPRDDMGLSNVVGVRENILEVPAAAAENYRLDLNKVFRDGNVPAGTFSASGFDDLISIDNTLLEFTTKHAAWIKQCKDNHKPMIGGISGHTLGYMNLYQAALLAAAAKGPIPDNAPVLETMRAVMIGGLIGNKRHHSYDEVMSASHAMPDGRGGDPMAYKYIFSYADVFSSTLEVISGAAQTAKGLVTDDISNIVVKAPNTVLSAIVTDLHVTELEKQKLIAAAVAYAEAFASTDAVAFKTAADDLIKVVTDITAAHAQVFKARSGRVAHKGLRKNHHRNSKH